MDWFLPLYWRLIRAEGRHGKGELERAAAAYCLTCLLHKYTVIVIFSGLDRASLLFEINFVIKRVTVSSHLISVHERGEKEQG